MRILTRDFAETQRIAQLLARLLQPNDVILLKGDLGVGKTTFTKGLALGLGIDHRIKSPTFDIVNEYHQGRIPLFHLDVYRLEKTGGNDLGLEEYFNGSGVSVVEWPQFILDDLPRTFLLIKILRQTNEIDDSRREIELLAVGDHYQRQQVKFISLLKKEFPTLTYSIVTDPK
ncbi:tRNA (adenosine(37)-N6)-threonylcarbamoyltransferase complex ATPase subunit type 1 TsaE [Liquorilactobacillus sicerae]|uniref:tRNA (adenosine(37)-N6)-threonylcarbamoyltransferase complex ATPase subunit type 1 TsaE n=1 Tax=Liquorilactobacillus sicerae TaxID=1416943 RepID=UPI002480B942|nr:tRNA (adenosine(37)-N6)-threonylcarbamoyltransferase complex ATPase subunit type 1 TsaE [Liquorilactobacillus sicerae]